MLWSALNVCDFHLDIQLKQKSTEILISDFSPVTTAAFLQLLSFCRNLPRMPGYPAGCTKTTDTLSVALRNK